MTHKHFSMSNFVIQRNIASGVCTFVPKVFMVKVHVLVIVFRPHFEVLEMKMNTKQILILFSLPL